MAGDRLITGETDLLSLGELFGVEHLRPGDFSGVFLLVKSSRLCDFRARSLFLLSGVPMIVL